MTPEGRAEFWAGWRRGVVISLVSLAVGLAAGRFSAPERVETRDVDRWHTLDLKTEDITRGMTFARTVEVTRWRNVVTTITDAGTTITDKTIEHEGSTENTATTEQLHRVEVVEVERERVVEKTVTVRPQFRASLLAGASLREPWLVLSGPLVLGLQFDVRLFGGLSLGLWINTFGAAGGAVSLEF